MDEIKMQGLLNEVCHINNKYEEIVKITGENFNVFDILGRSKHENSHSAFIAELLNPNGSHGCKDAFLKLFLNQFLTDGEMPNFADGEVNVFTEYFIGFKSLKEESESELPSKFSGRIDILIENSKSKSIIIIENKIDAPDQENQIKRYYEFASKEPKRNFKIFYLKKFRDSASSISANDLVSDFKIENSVNETCQANYFCISFKGNIIKWLETCLKEASNYPFVRESISQYINLLRKLTNKSTTQKMGQDIQEIIRKDSKNFLAGSLIAGEFENTKRLILDNFWKEGIKAINTKFNVDVKIEFKKANGDILNAWCPYIFIPIKHINKFIGIEPLNGKHWKSNYNNLFIGIFNPNGNQLPENPYKEWEKIINTYYDFGSENILSKIIDPNESEAIKLDILEKVQELMDTLKNLEEK